MVNHSLYIDQFIRTGSTDLAVSLGLGLLFLAAAYVILWTGLNGGWGDQRSFWMVLLIVALITLFIFPDLAIICGMLMRGWFFGSLAAIGWLSFGALVLLAGVAIGIKLREVAPGQPEPSKPALAREPARPVISAATFWPLPKPKTAPEPSRLERVQTPPAVLPAYRRETMPVVRNRRK
jgi:hypothetical protein